MTEVVGGGDDGKAWDKIVERESCVAKELQKSGIVFSLSIC